MSHQLYLADRARRGLVHVSKDRRQRQGVNAAITSAGVTTAGVGLIAGGIPGAKANGNSVWNIRSGSGKGVRRAVSTVRGAAPAASAIPGGILGFRHSIHAGGLYGFDQKRKQASRKKPKSSTEAFYRGHNNGKIPPEHAVMRGMKTGQKVAHGALGAGAGLAAYGLVRTRRDQVKKAARKQEDHTPGYSGALAGAGASGAVIAQGGSMYLRGQEKKYARRAGVNVDRAGKLVPKLAGRQLARPTESQRFAEKHYGVKPDLKQTMHPKVSDGDIGRRGLMRGVPHKTAEQAGRLRGAAAQERHFSEVFRSTGKVVRSFRTPSAIVGAAGAGGLVAMKQKNGKR